MKWWLNGGTCSGRFKVYFASRTHVCDLWLYLLLPATLVGQYRKMYIISANQEPKNGGKALKIYNRLYIKCRILKYSSCCFLKWKILSKQSIWPYQVWPPLKFTFWQLCIMYLEFNFKIISLIKYSVTHFSRVTGFDLYHSYHYECYKSKPVICEK